MRVQRGVDLGDQLALAVARAQLDRAVGLGGGAVGQIRMVLVLVLKVLQCVARFFQDFVLPDEQLGAEIFALALVHERLFLGRPVAVEAMPVLLSRPRRGFFRRPGLLFFLPQHPTATPSTAPAAGGELIAIGRPADNSEVGHPTRHGKRAVQHGFGQMEPGLRPFPGGPRRACRPWPARPRRAARSRPCTVSRPGSPVGSARPAPADLEPRQRAGIERSGQKTEFQRIEGIERAPPAPHRLLAALARLFDALQREQRVDSADIAHAGRRRRPCAPGFRSRG